MLRLIGSDDVMGILKLLSDEEFVSKIISLDSIEEVQKAFKEKGVEISVGECQELGKEIKKILAAKDDELEEVVGGIDDEVVTCSMCAVLFPIAAIGMYKLFEKYNGCGEKLGIKLGAWIRKKKNASPDKPINESTNN